MAHDLITDVRFGDLRMPYNDALTVYGIDNPSWKVLIDTVFPNASSPDSVVMALQYCKARNLDVFKRPVHIVPMWSTAKRAMIDTIWPAISELRTTAARTGEFAGRDECEFGDAVTLSLGAAKIVVPQWARVTVYRLVKGHRCRFVGPKVFWIESYASKKKDDPTPNDMWARRIYGQIEKCAEAAALRLAFPEEIGGEYCAEEMEGQRLYDDRPQGFDEPKRIAKGAPPPDPDAPPAKTRTDDPSPPNGNPVEGRKEPPKGPPPPPDPEPPKERHAPPPPDPAPPKELGPPNPELGDDGGFAGQLLKQFENRLQNCHSEGACDRAYALIIRPVERDLDEQELHRMVRALNWRKSELEEA